MSHEKKRHCLGIDGSEDKCNSNTGGCRGINSNRRLARQTFAVENRIAFLESICPPCVEEMQTTADLKCGDCESSLCCLPTGKGFSSAFAPPLL